MKELSEIRKFGLNDWPPLSLTVPKTSSSVGLTFRNSTYKDATLSSYNFNQNRGDVNFTIRF